MCKLVQFHLNAGKLHYNCTKFPIEVFPDDGEAKAGATGKFEHFALFTDLKSFFFVSLFFLFMLTCAYLCYLGTLVGFEHTCGDLGTICLPVYYEKQVLPNIVK